MGYGISGSCISNTISPIHLHIRIQSEWRRGHFFVLLFSILWKPSSSTVGVMSPQKYKSGGLLTRRSRGRDSRVRACNRIAVVALLIRICLRKESKNWGLQLHVYTHLLLRNRAAFKTGTASVHQPRRRRKPKWATPIKF